MPSKSKSRGNMKPAEVKPLLMASLKAFGVQSSSGLIDNDETFDAWRHRQCMAAVKKPGITACNHKDFLPLLAHFQTLAGDDAAAFRSLVNSGKPTDHAAPGDTYETRRTIVNQIADALAAHHHLATTPSATLLTEAMEFNQHLHPDTAWDASPLRHAFSKMIARKEAIKAKGKGPITVGYLIYLVRQKTRRPDLTLGHDWKAGLTERCTSNQLSQIRSTIINRIAAVEGTGTAKDRNKSQISRSRGSFQ